MPKARNRPRPDPTLDLLGTPEPLDLAYGSAFQEVIDGFTAEIGALVPDSRYEEFKEKYYLDPAGFWLDCFTWPEDQKPAFYQLQIMNDVVQHGRVCARGPRGLGKTAMSAVLVLWFALTRDGRDWKVPTTAGSWRQLTKFLWPEIHKWARRIKWEVVGREPFNAQRELLSQTLKLKTGEAYAAVSDNPETIEGAHGDHILFLYDEAKIIPEKTFDATEGTFANAARAPFPVGHREAYLVAVSTPGLPNGRFYDIQSRKKGYEDWHVTRVTLSDTIKAGLITREHAESRKNQWGETSQVYLNHILGEFAADESVGFIPLAYVEHAMELYDEWVEAGKPDINHTSCGVDVGDGSDKSVIASQGTLPEGLTYKDPDTGESRKIRAKKGIYELKESRERGVMPITGAAKNVLDGRGGVAVVDKNGVGAGAIGRLREMGYDKLLIGFNGQSKAPPGAKDASGEIKPGNMRAWGYIHLRDLLNPANGHGYMLPTSDKQQRDALVGDLTIPKAKPLDSEGRLFIEKKEDIRKSLGRSTDYGDAVMMAAIAEGVGKPKVKKYPSRSYNTY